MTESPSMASLLPLLGLLLLAQPSSAQWDDGKCPNLPVQMRIAVSYKHKVHFFTWIKEQRNDAKYYTDQQLDLYKWYYEVSNFNKSTYEELREAIEWRDKLVLDYDNSVYQFRYKWANQQEDDVTPVPYDMVVPHNVKKSGSGKNVLVEQKGVYKYTYTEDSGGIGSYDEGKQILGPEEKLPDYMPEKITLFEDVIYFGDFTRKKDDLKNHPDFPNPRVNYSNGHLFDLKYGSAYGFPTNNFNESVIGILGPNYEIYREWCDESRGRFSSELTTAKTGKSKQRDLLKKRENVCFAIGNFGKCTIAFGPRALFNDLLVIPWTPVHRPEKLPESSQMEFTRQVPVPTLDFEIEECAKDDEECKAEVASWRDW
ncbi:hypothetical protein L596_017503 [Steinernema carpocapsae]|uniref:Uncharacterized protein n=2 Tax=Steinernema carpocapsae TaxID=34508 RepID=A0A4U5N296_STECR|nr:hypothetical protein L596_017503 [Steinernema carpocapsae]